MCTTIRIVLAMVREAFLSRAALHLENLALRQQLAALDRKGARPSLRMADRLFWVVLSRLWSGWREILVIVKPETVIGWHRKGFRRFWTRKSRRGKPGRPPVSSEFRGLIRRMSRENPLWGAPRIHGELRMLGFEVSEAAVSKYMPRHPKPPSQTWRTFLENHVGCLASTDFFVVPTATFSLLFVLVVLRHERRRIVHIGTTAHPTAAWVAQQIREAFPWETAPRYMIRDRDRVYGIAFRSRIKAMGIEEVVTAPRSPWQSPYVERVIGSIRRECLDHVIVLNERHLRAIPEPRSSSSGVARRDLNQARRVRQTCVQGTGCATRHCRPTCATMSRRRQIASLKITAHTAVCLPTSRAGSPKLYLALLDTGP